MMEQSQGFRAVCMAALFLFSGCALTQKRPHYPDHDRLVSVVKIESAGERPIFTQDLLVLRSESKTLEQTTAYIFRGIDLTEGTPERIHSARVTEDFFPALGIKPALGRALLSVDAQPGSGAVVVISYTLWRRRFGGDPNLIGRSISLNQEPYTVVGIMPPDFRSPKDCDAWTPLAYDFNSITLSMEGEKLKRTGTEVEVFARLKSGVTLEQARAEMRLITGKLEEERSEKNAGRSLNLIPLRESNKQADNVLEIKLKRPAPLPAETGKEK